MFTEYNIVSFLLGGKRRTDNNSVLSELIGILCLFSKEFRLLVRKEKPVLSVWETASKYVRQAKQDLPIT